MPKTVLLYIVLITSTQSLPELTNLGGIFQVQFGTKIYFVQTDGHITAAVDTTFAKQLEGFFAGTCVSFERV